METLLIIIGIISISLTPLIIMWVVDSVDGFTPTFTPTHIIEMDGRLFEKDNIHGGLKEMNKQKTIKYLVQQVTELKRELKYVEHKNDKPEIEKVCSWCAGDNYICEFSIIYPNHKERRIDKVDLGTYRIGTCGTYGNNVEIVQETDEYIYVEFKHNVVPYDSIIKRINKKDGEIAEFNTIEFQHVQSCETKKRGRPRKNKEK